MKDRCWPSGKRSLLGPLPEVAASWFPEGSRTGRPRGFERADVRLRLCMQCLENSLGRRRLPTKILLANDLDLFLAAENTFFRRREVDLIIARTGEEAYDLARLHKPDLIFLNLTMEGMDGDLCCRKIRSHPELRAIPVVLITEGKRREDLDRCCEAECDDVLTKPLGRPVLLAVVRKFLEVTERAAPRVEARLRVHVRQNQTLRRGYSVNLSSGGLFLETASPPSVDTDLALRFSLADGVSTIRCHGRVSWINPSGEDKVPHLPTGMGIQFTDLSAEDLEKIQNFVKCRFIARLR